MMGLSSMFWVGVVFGFWGVGALGVGGGCAGGGLNVNRCFEPHHPQGGMMGLSFMFWVGVIFGFWGVGALGVGRFRG